MAQRKCISHRAAQTGNDVVLPSSLCSLGDIGIVRDKKKIKAQIKPCFVCLWSKIEKNLSSALIVTETSAVLLPPLGVSPAEL